MIENIALAFRGIWSHRLRSFLTMLGIIIGIAAIITIVSTIKGINDQIKEKLVGGGSNLVTVSLTMENGYFDAQYQEMPEGVYPLDDETFKEVRQLDHVLDATRFLQRNWSDGTYYGNRVYNGAMMGIDEHYLSMNEYSVRLGRGFAAEDYSEHRKVVLIDTNVRTSLFEGENPVGETLEIQGEPFIVVGVVDRDPSNAVQIDSPSDYYMYSTYNTGMIFLPISSWSIIYRYDEVQSVQLKASSTDIMTRVGDAAAAVLNKACVINEEYQYKADDLLEQAAELQELSSSTNMQLLWIAGISLLVGGIGVMNIMLVSVTERTREIGLKKAIGARRRRILAQFLTEAAVLTSLGGLLGVACGILLARLLSGILDIPSGISIPACVVAVVFSMVIGILFGLIPAMKASRLNPIEALRRD